MNNLESVLVESINKFNGAIDKGVDFALEQSPDVIQQLLVWNATLSAISMLAFVLLAIAWIVAEIKLFNKLKKEEQLDDIDAIFFVYIAGGLARIIPTLAISHLFSLTWLKILIAPKLYLLEYAATLIK